MDEYYWLFLFCLRLFGEAIDMSYRFGSSFSIQGTASHRTQVVVRWMRSTVGSALARLAWSRSWRRRGIRIDIQTIDVALSRTKKSLLGGACQLSVWWFATSIDFRWQLNDARWWWTVTTVTTSATVFGIRREMMLLLLLRRRVTATRRSRLMRSVYVVQIGAGLLASAWRRTVIRIIGRLAAVVARSVGIPLLRWMMTVARRWESVFGIAALRSPFGRRWRIHHLK